MSDNEIYRALCDSFAYDTGCTDICDNSNLSHNELKEELTNMDEDNLRVTLSNFIRDYFLTDDAISQGYGIEDVKRFIEWLDEVMDIYI